jgi:hypothetical protein
MKLGIVLLSETPKEFYQTTAQHVADDSTVFEIKFVHGNKKDQRPSLTKYLFCQVQDLFGPLLPYNVPSSVRESTLLYVQPSFLDPQQDSLREEPPNLWSLESHRHETFKKIHRNYHLRSMWDIIVYNWPIPVELNQVWLTEMLQRQIRLNKIRLNFFTLHVLSQVEWSWWPAFAGSQWFILHSTRLD